MIETRNRASTAVRVPAIVAWVAVALALAFGFVGRATDVAAFDAVAGLLWVVALVAALSLLPFWGRIVPAIPPMPGLFPRPAEGERWCTSCGTPAPAGADCACGAPGRTQS